MLIESDIRQRRPLPQARGEINHQLPQTEMTLGRQPLCLLCGGWGGGSGLHIVS